MTAIHDMSAVDLLGGVDILFLNHPGPALGLARDIDHTVLESQFRMMVASPIRLVSRASPARTVQASVVGFPAAPGKLW